MARFTHIRNNFLIGEVSPRLWGRTELEEYTQMCERLRNKIVYPQGGCGRRPGSNFVADLSTAALDGCKLFSFPTSDGEFIIVVGSSTLSYVEVSGAGTVVDFTTKHLDPLEYGTNWNYGSEITTKRFSSSKFGDLLFITAGNNEPLVIARLPPSASPDKIGYFRFGEGNTTFPLTGSVWSAAEAHRHMAWIDENTTSTTIAASATTGSITLTASASIFSSDMVSASGVLGTLFRIRSGSSVGVAKVTGYTNATTLSATVLKTLPGTTALTTWSESAWSLRRGFPRTVQFHNQRIFWGGTNFQPDTVWASQVGDYTETSKPDITSTFNSSDAISLSFALGDLTTINYMSSGRRNLEIGTNSREVNLENTTGELADAGVVFQATYESSEGSVYIQPVRVNNTLIFMNSFSQKTLEYSYEFREDSYKTKNLNYFAEDIFKKISYGTNKQCLEMAYQGVENNIIWFNCQDSLIGLTRNREYNVFAFHKHYLGGLRDDGAGNKVVARVDSLCNLSRSSGQDELYMAVHREINDLDVLYLEKFTTEFDGDTLDDYSSTKSYLNTYPVYMDCAVIIGTGDLGPTDSWTSLAHAGETVSLIADGQYMGEISIATDGTFTTAEEHHYVIIGFNYISEVVPIALQSNSLFGSGIGQIKRVEEVSILFNRTVGAQFGVLTNEDNLEDIEFRPTSAAPSDPIPLYTGEKIIKLTASYETRQNIIVRQSIPLPCQVTAIVSKGILYD